MCYVDLSSAHGYVFIRTLVLYARSQIILVQHAGLTKLRPQLSVTDQPDCVAAGLYFS